MSMCCGHPHHVDDQLDVEVRLDAAIAVLADVLADHLVPGAGKEGVELALVLVLRVEAGVGVRANEIAAGGGGLEQGDVIDVHPGRLGGVEDVGNVHEDGHVLAHERLLCWVARASRAAEMPHTVGGWRRSPRATIRMREMGTIVINGPPRRR